MTIDSNQSDRVYDLPNGKCFLPSILILRLEGTLSLILINEKFNGPPIARSNSTFGISYL